MNIVSKILPFILLCSLSVSAQECAIVQFSPQVINGEEYITVIGVHNNNYIEKYDTKKSLMTGLHNYYLEPGIHSVQIEQWPLNVFKRLKRLNKTPQMKRKSAIYSQFVQIELLADRKYEIKMTSTSTPDLRQVNINAVEETQCDNNETKILAAKTPTQSFTVLENELLPEVLEYRLRKLMTKLANTSTRYSIAKYETNLFPTKLNNIIGTMLDSEYSDDGKAIKVLSVLPYSLASKLKLFSGDKITRLGKYYISRNAGTPNQQLAKYFSSLYFNDEISIEVQRGEENVTLKMLYTPTIIPEIKYTIAKNNRLVLPKIFESHLLSGDAMFEFDQLMVELTDYFLAQGVENKQVEIIRDKIKETSFGLSGERTYDLGQLALKVLDVKPESIAEQMGLNTLDVITSINNIQLNENNIESMIQSLQNIEDGSQISFVLQRKGKKLTIKNAYSASNLVAYRLVLDLNSINVVSNRVAELVKNNRKRKWQGYQRYQHRNPATWYYKNGKQNNQSFRPAPPKNSSGKGIE